MTTDANRRLAQFIFDPGAAHRSRSRSQLESFLVKFPRAFRVGYGNGNEGDFCNHDDFSLWMMILLPSGSWTMAMWQTGDSNGSQANFTFAFFSSLIA